jgi:hypothetical protein
MLILWLLVIYSVISSILLFELRVELDNLKEEVEKLKGKCK